MNRTGFVLIAATSAAILCLGACAELDKLDGTRTSDNNPQPGAALAEAREAAASSSAASESAESFSAKEQKEQRESSASK